MKKRILSLCLAIVMVLGMFPVAASATEIPESLNIVRITGVTGFEESEPGIVGLWWGSEYHEDVPVFVASVPEGTEEVKLTLEDGTYPSYESYQTGALMVSGAIATYGDNEGYNYDCYVYNAGGGEFEAIQEEDGLNAIVLNVAELIENEQYYVAYDPSNAPSYILGFVYAEASETETPACQHGETDITYGKIEGEEKHTITEICANKDCVQQIGEVSTVDCVDEDKNLKCDKCEDSVACKHEGNETTIDYEQVEGTETHTVTVKCANTECGETIGEVTTADCVDDDKNGECDLCKGTVKVETPAAPTGPWDGTTLTEPAQVDGVYQIGTGAELAWFAQTADPASKAVLTADIDLNNQTWTAMAKLSGSFDGQGHTVKGLNGSQGLFNSVYGESNSARAEVKNVTVEGTVSGGMKSAGIAGSAYWANFTNVINKANVTGTSQYVAGIVGYSLQGVNGSYITLTNCGNEGTITGSTTNVAGLVAYGKGAMVLVDCYNTGDITGSCTSYSNSGVGGLVGYTQGYKDASSLTNCYNTGSVNGKSGYAGGIVGTMYNGVTATNCYNIGTVTGGSGKIGAITGYAYNASSSKAVNCYYLDTSCAAAATGKPAAVDAGTTVKTAAEMQSVEFIESLGEAYEKGENHPVLKWEGKGVKANAYKVTAPEGEGFTFEGAAEATDTEVYKFSVAIKDFYETTEAFAVKINGVAQEAVSSENHVYSFEYTAAADFAITVEGIQYTGVKLDKTEETLYPNDTVTLTATVDPNAEGTVTWASSNDAVATVVDGVVTALKAGEANITATVGEVSAICRITVDHRPTVVSNGWGSGQTKIDSVTLYDVTVKEHYWKGNTGIVVLDAETPMDAAVRFDKTGSANLLIDGNLLNSAHNTASLVDGYAKLILAAEVPGGNVNRTMIIWVDGAYEYVPVTGIEIPAGSYTDGNYRVVANSATQMTAKVLPENATIQDVEWSTTASSTALTVNKDGYVQGSTMGHGSYYTLTVASVEDPSITATCKIYLDWKPEDSITISEQSMTLQVGETGTLSATVSGTQFVTNTTVTWESEDESIATVSGGKVTGLKNGTVTITAKSYYGLTATCEVTVEGGVEECDHVNTETTTLYDRIEGTEKHTVTVICACGEPIGEATTADCADTDKDGKCDQCEGEVKRAITKLTWWISGAKKTEITVNVDDVVDATTGCTPKAAYAVTYTSADSEIVTVNTPEATADAEYGHANTSFTAKKVGETTITAAAKDDPSVKAELKVTVVCPHHKTETAYAPVEGTKKHTVTVTCTHEGCKQQISQNTADCVDEGTDGKCDLCKAEMTVAPQLGDVDGKDGITADDAALILRAVAKLAEVDETLADVDGKDGVTADDAALILRYVAQLITEFPVQQQG